MSLEVIKTQMRQFLASQEPEVLAVRGDWGVGKTFTWEQTLNEAQALKQSGEDPNAIGLDHYSYVSLFGVSSLQDLRTEIAFNKLNTIDLKHAEGITKFQQASGRYMPKILSQVFKYAGVNTGTLVDTMFASMSNSMIRNTIVCIDDFERSNIPEKETLGLINDLKCKRGCKVVLLLNDKITKEFQSYREKVIDYDLEFKLNSKEATGLVFGKNHENRLYSLIESNCEKLGIKNIRIIQKIKNIVDEATKNHKLNEYHFELQNQFIQSSVLAAYCFYDHKPETPKFSYIRDTNLRNQVSIKTVMASRYGQDDEAPEDKIRNEKYIEYERFLYDYGFMTTDKLDQVIFDSIESGFINFQDFETWATKKDEELRIESNKSELANILDSFRTSFFSEDELPRKIYELTESSKVYISSMLKADLNEIYSLLDYFDSNTQKMEIVELYISKYREFPDKFDTSSDSNLRDIKWHQDLKKILDDEYKKISAPPSAKEIIYSLLEEIRPLNNYEIEILNNLEAEEIQNIIDNAESRIFYRLIELLVKIQFREPELLTLRENVINILKNYARKSKQAAFMIKYNFGNILDESTP
ncbi:hypothetical protein [Marinobacter nauticus]|uniref:hypothetical protein n=1 Tax=Marinobacter nauticus TaxID=2743 RepID=UPI001C98EAAA|nr:hypothetical protein [Marinobacter nauticus]MBY5962089.1 hypothetical protein [Marinobacter nauticus]